MATITATITELVQWADKNGQDPIQAVLDYMLEKDSRITRIEAERLVVRAKQTLLAQHHLLEAMVEHERVAGQIYSITTEDVEAFLNEHADLSAKLEGLDPEVLAFEIYDAIGETGIVEMVEKAIREAIESAALQPGPDKEKGR